jgi:hypothetical protein
MTKQTIIIPKNNKKIDFTPVELVAVYRVLTAFLDAVDYQDKTLPRGLLAMVPLIGDVESKIFARLELVAQ